MEKIKILVVDDEPSICNMILRFLSMNNYDGEMAHNGKEAVKLLEKNEYQIVLTDIKMPEMDGITLMKIAKGINPNLLFIIMSGYGTLDSAIDSMKMGALNFIKKPISIVELIATIKKAEDLLTTRNLSVKMKQFITGIDKSIELTTKDLSDNLEIVVDYLSTEVKNFGVDKVVVDNITLALFESLSNAIEHGNLQLEKDISRETSVEVFEDFLKEKMRKLEIPEYADKKISIYLSYIDGRVEFTVTDEGIGFDHNEFISGMNDSIYTDRMKRGLFMINSVMDDVKFNDKGNQIKMSVSIDREG